MFFVGSYLFLCVILVSTIEMFLFNSDDLLDVLESLEFTYSKYPALKDDFKKGVFSVRSLCSSDFHKGKQKMFSRSTERL